MRSNHHKPLNPFRWQDRPSTPDSPSPYRRAQVTQKFSRFRCGCETYSVFKQAKSLRVVEKPVHWLSRK